jgi:hypothetical protein
MNPLIDAPYSFLPEDMSVVVVIHGTEVVTLARKNEARYTDAVQRMRYCASQGVKFSGLWLAADRLWLPRRTAAGLCGSRPIRHHRTGALAKPGVCAGHPGGDRKEGIH